MSIGTRIKEARLRSNLTQEELAKKLEITKGAVANYETGVSSPKIEIMFKLFNVLNIDANYLYQDEMKESDAQTRDQVLVEKYHEADDGIKKSVDILLKMPE